MASKVQKFIQHILHERHEPQTSRNAKDVLLADKVYNGTHINKCSHCFQLLVRDYICRAHFYFILFYLFIYFCLFAISWPAPAAYGGSQARGPIGAVATTAVGTRF